ncbi:hypothetical protein BSKO_08308 [Bryopsis sp. KO-2023]|nr:hypothetical protein BSKO_08308 [Bryopsis sp. KO-2023]
MLLSAGRKALSLRAAAPLWRYCSGTSGKDGMDQTTAHVLEPVAPTIRHGRPSPKGTQEETPNVPDNASTQGTEASDGVVTGLGGQSSTHIAAPEEAKKDGEGGLITFLGSQGPKPEDDVITFLGDKPEEATPEAEEILTSSFEVVLAEQAEEKELPRLIPKKKRKEMFSLMDALKAVEEVQKRARAGFEETVEAHFRLLADPRRGDQLVRGAIVLPHGTGKQLRVAVFAEGDAVKAAKAAGADLVGSEELIKDIQASGGSILNNIDKCVATPDMMRHLGKLGRILGPKGLMPNPKMGTLTNNVTEALDEIKKGRVEFRADKSGNVHVGIGKVKFDTAHLYRNLGVLSGEILKVRPKGLKGSGTVGYVGNLTLCSTMGPGIPISIASMLTAVQNARSGTA